MIELVTIAEAAGELHVGTRTLRRWVADGAPVARRGRRGRGCSTLVDLGAIEAWRAAQAVDARLLALAGEIPELVADAIYALAMDIDDGKDKRRIFGALVGAWYATTTAVLDRIRRDAPGVPDVSAVPRKMIALRGIFEGSRMVPLKSQGK